MLVDDKPPLDEDLLMHFGVPGMKWGHRKARDTGGSGRSGGSASPKKPMSVKTKTILAGVGVSLAVGGAATAYILAKRSGVKIPKVATAGRIERALARYPARNVKPLLNAPHVSPGLPSRQLLSRAPSPFQMRLQAGQAAHENMLSRLGNQKLTDKTWRDAVKIKRMSREMDDATSSLLRGNSDALKRSNSFMSVADIRKAMDDPNHVWEL